MKKSAQALLISIGLCTLAMAGQASDLRIIDDVSYRIASDPDNFSYDLPTFPENTAFPLHRYGTEVPVNEDKGAQDILPQAPLSAFGLPCETKFHLTPVIGEPRVTVDLHSPCYGNTRATFEHAGLEFEMHLPVTGEIAFEMPVLKADTELTVHLGDETVKSVRMPAVDLSGIARAAIAMQSPVPLKLTGSEDVRYEIIGGPEGRHLQVATVNRHTQARNVARMVLRREVTAQSCNLAVEALVFRQVGEAPASTYDLSLAAPGCDKIGTIQVLKTAVEDLRLAEN